MNNDYKYTPEELYNNTNQGLDILYRYEPACIGCMGAKNFKFNKGERTASASLFIPEGANFWAIKDFSSGETRNEIHRQRIWRSSKGLIRRI